MKPMEVMDDSSESGKKNQQRPSRLLSSLRRNVNVFRSATGSGASQVLEHETRPFLSGATSTSTSGTHATGGGATGTSSDKHPHGHALPTHTKSNFEIYSVRDRRDATAKRAFKVQIPKRMMYYTMMVFLVLPLALFLWKEMHLDNHHRDPATHDLVKSHLRAHHDVYPTWMEEAVGTVWNDHDAPTNEILATTTTNDTFAILDTADQPHVGTAWDEIITDTEKIKDNHSNSTSGIPDDMVETGDSFSVGSVSSTETISATGIDSDRTKEQNSDSVKFSTTELEPGADGGSAGNHDTTPGGDGDTGNGTDRKLPPELAEDLLGTGLESLGKEMLGVVHKPPKDDDDVLIP
jgi:hypothetical protein